MAYCNLTPRWTLVLRKAEPPPGTEIARRAWSPWGGSSPGPAGRLKGLALGLGLQHEELGLGLQRDSSTPNTPRGLLTPRRPEPHWLKRPGQNLTQGQRGTRLSSSREGCLWKQQEVLTPCSFRMGFFPLRTRGHQRAFPAQPAMSLS